MQLNIVPTRSGLQWAMQGIRTFWRQPLALSGIFFLFMATESLLSMLPLVGPALALMVLPALTLGLMAASQLAAGGKFPMPAVLFTALKTAPQRKAMFKLGALYALLFIGVMLASVLVDGGTFAKVYLGGVPLTPEVVNSATFQAATWLTLVLSIPLSMMFWHAPALVHWQGLPVMKSLFFSLMACWRNLRAFALYVLVWMGVFMAAGFLALVASALLGDAKWMSAIFTPLALCVMAMFFTSMMLTVKDCFGSDEQAQTPH